MDADATPEMLSAISEAPFAPSATFLLISDVVAVCSSTALVIATGLDRIARLVEQHAPSSGERHRIAAETAHAHRALSAVDTIIRDLSHFSSSAMAPAAVTTSGSVRHAIERAIEQARPSADVVDACPELPGVSLDTHRSTARRVLRKPFALATLTEVVAEELGRIGVD